jgi:hypothetical protein
MRTRRFGRKLALPATIAIKHQSRMRMDQDEFKKAEVDARPKHFADDTGKTCPQSDFGSLCPGGPPVVFSHPDAQHFFECSP